MPDPGTILLVEDNPDHVILFCLALKKAGFPNRVQVVKGGEEAILYLEGQGRYGNRTEHPLPDLLLLDLKMPGLDGFDVIAWVRKQTNELKNLPVIVLTTSSHGSDVARAYQAGANSFLVKPMDLNECVAQMKTMGDFWLNECELPPSKLPPRAP
jgi:CheY-like chemotaxis protein